MSSALIHHEAPAAQQFRAPSYSNGGRIKSFSSGSELRLANGVSLSSKFDGELARRSQTYAATGIRTLHVVSAPISPPSFRGRAPSHAGK